LLMIAADAAYFRSKGAHRLPCDVWQFNSTFNQSMANYRPSVLLAPSRTWCAFERR
jgi:hypothetical protein